MKFHELLDHYYFHDSELTGMHYYPEKKQLLCDIVLSGWSQSMEERCVENAPGKLIFTDVTLFTMDSTSMVFDDEILTMEKVESEEPNDQQKMLIVLARIVFPQKEQIITVVHIEANDVVWKPL